ncbi:type III secretion system export apparatus subunit SctT [Motilimonas pumila]|uniref:EscT/YscT/HrcT family type III secretion system export apparatus protein n=1 Tax=Motilimonas pumila TaxID=2303987 RepID=A0A418YE89_9GAMM|nr:type III secretion system export apparatus subunit SctT [Motilimonas pumila]RJG42794.1 EscT/YscT/HrcT family type III secretion system export apparatus protein [Motilimonas pumila]
MSFPIELETIESVAQTYSLGLPRLFVVFMIMPVLSKRFLGGAMIRNCALMSIALFLYPVTEGSIPNELTLSNYFSIFIKEVVLGVVMGYIATVPFWVAQGVGFFIDNQRGAAMASMMNPLLGEQTSPLGLFLSQLLVTLFVISGALMALLVVLIQSYTIWPVGVLYPEFIDGLDTFALAQLDLLMELIVVLSAPVILAMFLAEFALALISRFAPQLNVFFLAMPVKSAVGFFVLVLYIRYLVDHLKDFIDKVPEQIIDFIQAPLLF